MACDDVDELELSVVVEVTARVPNGEAGARECARLGVGAGDAHEFLALLPRDAEDLFVCFVGFETSHQCGASAQPGAETEFRRAEFFADLGVHEEIAEAEVAGRSARDVHRRGREGVEGDDEIRGCDVDERAAELLDNVVDGLVEELVLVEKALAVVAVRVGLFDEAVELDAQNGACFLRESTGRGVELSLNRIGVFTFFLQSATERGEAVGIVLNELEVFGSNDFGGERCEGAGDGRGGRRR